MKRAREGDAVSDRRDCAKKARSHASTVPYLPLEMLHEIAHESEGAYRALLALPCFARSLTVDGRMEYRLHFGHSVEISRDLTEWKRRGVDHRLDGPATEGIDGYKEWYRDGKRNCANGPALETPDGTREWWQDDKPHRDAGPALEYADGHKQWWRNGKPILSCN